MKRVELEFAEETVAILPQGSEIGKWALRRGKMEG
jgi:hypothetical protein